MTYLGNPFHFWSVLTVGMIVYSMPFNEMLKLSFKESLDYTKLFPAIGG